MVMRIKVEVTGFLLTCSEIKNFKKPNINLDLYDGDYNFQT